MDFDLDFKIINDTIYGQITLHPLLTAIIATSEFERLKHLKQLGIVNYVYPCANNTRHEHSIGTSYLAGELIRHLKQQQGDEYDITVTDVLCVQVAGLLHDIGHGPFSHLFEHVVERLINQKWKHESMSVQIIEKIYNDLKQTFNLHGLYELQIDLIKDMITFNGVAGEEKIKNLSNKWKGIYGKGWNKTFLFEIVSNHRNGIDVDKFDYFERDSLYLGLRSNFQPFRYIKYSRIITVDGIAQICLRDTVAPNLYEMYHIRIQLYRYAYKHKVCCALEHMITDAFVKADKVLNFKEKINDVTQYCQLTDSIREDILFFQTNKKTYLNAIDSLQLNLKPEEKAELRKNLDILQSGIEKELDEAKHLLKRIELRRLYKLFGQTIYLKNDEIDGRKKEEIKNEILNEFHKLGGTDLSADELIIDVVKLNYGAGEHNPIDNVCFFNKSNTNRPFKLKREQVSLMLPQTFQEIIIRFFCTKEGYHDESGLASYELLKKALINWFKLKKDENIYSLPWNFE